MTAETWRDGDPAETRPRMVREPIVPRPTPGSSLRLRRWLIPAAVILIALGLGGIWLDGGDDPAPGLAPAGDLPVIRAERDPVKERPAEPGGMEVENRDKLVYQRLQNEESPPPMERLLPPPEEPLAPPAPPPPAEPPAEAAGEPSTPTPPPAAAAPADDAGAAPAAILPPPKPRPVARTEPAIAAAGYQVQIAAGRSEEGVRAAADRLKADHRDVFGGLTLEVVRADLGSQGIFYRLRAGPIASEQAARALCAKLADRKIGCVVVRPGA